MEVSSDKAPVRLDFTTATKAFAICLVVFTHADWAEADRLCPVFPFVVSAAVPLFMMVTGLNYARSYLRRRTDDLKGMYDLPTLRRRAGALVLPYVPVILIEIPLAVFRNHLGFSSIDLSFMGLLKGLVSGGWGPGGYYLPVMIQVIAIYPLLYCLVRRFGWAACAGVTAGCIVLDATQTALGFPDGAWRPLCFRYLPYLAFGVLLALHAGALRRVVGNGICLGLLVIGGGYLACLTYGPLAGVLSTLQSDWAGTSPPAGLYFMGVFGLLYLWLKDSKSFDSRWMPVEAVARNTWFIFLFQSIWYFAGANSVFDFLPVPVEAILFLCICVPAGCVFGAIWRRLTTKEPVIARK